MKLQVIELFAASRAVQVTVVRPGLNETVLSVVPVPVVAPDSEYEREETGQLSVAVAFQPVPECVYKHPLVVVTFCCPVTGHEMAGLSSSLTLTWNEHVAVRPAASVAVHVTVVIPALNATLLSVVPVPDVAPVSE